MTNVQDENFDSQEELEANPTNDGQDIPQEEGGEEPEIEMGENLSGDDGDEPGDGGGSEESRQARKERADAQIARLKEENKRLKEEKRKADRQEKVGASSTDMMAKAYLAATHDIKEPDAQDEAIRLADKFDMTVDELMEDADYKSKISSLQKRVVQNRKVAASTGGAAQRKKTAENVAKYFQQHQEFPADASVELRSKAIDFLTGKQRQNWQR